MQGMHLLCVLRLPYVPLLGLRMSSLCRLHPKCIIGYQQRLKYFPFHISSFPSAKQGRKLLIAYLDGKNIQNSMSISFPSVLLKVSWCVLLCYCVLDTLFNYETFNISVEIELWQFLFDLATMTANQRTRKILKCKSNEGQLPWVVLSFPHFFVSKNFLSRKLRHQYLN